MKAFQNVLLCAWVLWAFLPDGRITPVAAYPTRQECLVLRAKTLSHPDATSSVCLPDTTNPRP